MLKDSVFDIKYLGNDLLAARLESDEIQVFNIKSGSCVKNLYCKPGSMYPLKDEKLLTIPHGNSSNSGGYQVTLWDLQTLEKKDVTSEELEGAVFCVIQLANGTIVFDQEFYLLIKITFWQLDGLEMTFSNEIDNAHEDEILCLLELPDNLLASGSMDKTIKIWNLSDLTLNRVLEGHDDYVNSMILLPGEVLLSCDDDETIRAWDY